MLLSPKSRASGARPLDKALSEVPLGDTSKRNWRKRQVGALTSGELSAFQTSLFADSLYTQRLAFLGIAQKVDLGHGFGA